MNELDYGKQVENYLKEILDTDFLWFYLREIAASV